MAVNSNIFDFNIDYGDYFPEFSSLDVNRNLFEEYVNGLFYGKYGVNPNKLSFTTVYEENSNDGAIAAFKDEVDSIYNNIDLPNSLSLDFCKFCYSFAFYFLIESAFMIKPGARPNGSNIFSEITVTKLKSESVLSGANTITTTGGKMYGHSHPAILVGAYDYNGALKSENNGDLATTKIFSEMYEYFTKEGIFRKSYGDEKTNPLTSNGRTNSNCYLFIDNLGTNYKGVALWSNPKRPFYILPTPPIPSADDNAIVKTKGADRTKAKRSRNILITQAYVIFYDGTEDGIKYDEDGLDRKNYDDASKNSIYGVYDIKSGTWLGDSLYIIDDSDRKDLFKGNTAADFQEVLLKYLQNPSLACYRIENSLSLADDGLPKFVEYNIYGQEIRRKLKKLTSGGQGNSSDAVTVIKQTPEGTIYMASKEFSEDGTPVSEFCLGNKKVSEYSNILVKSPITGEDITSHWESKKSNIHFDKQQNTIIQSLNKLFTLATEIIIKAKSQNINLEEDSFINCVNYLVDALGDIILMSDSFNVIAKNASIDAEAIELVAPEVVIGQNDALEADIFNEPYLEGDTDANSYDAPLSRLKFIKWWNSSVAPAFELMADFIDNYNKHLHENTGAGVPFLIYKISDTSAIKGKDSAITATKLSGATSVKVI